VEVSSIFLRFPFKSLVILPFSLETVTDQRNQMAIADQNMKTLENEIKQHSYIEQKLNNTINKVKKEKEQMTEDLQNLSDRFDGVNEELNAKNYQINDYKDKLVESQARLLKIQHDLQSAQNDFINLEKELQLSKDTQEELKEKLKVRYVNDLTSS
jgi:septal ring factor EnvC (AmiA/AmiB activator)